MTSLTISRRLGNTIGFLVCVGLMCCALYFQYGMGLQPCPLCIFQRIAVITVGLIFLIAALHNPQRTGARVYAVLLVIATLSGAMVSARHVWIQAQPPGSVPACGASLDYLLDIMPVTDVITKVLTGSGECGRIDWSLFGLSMPWWVLFALVSLCVWALWVNLRRAGVR